MHLYCDKNHVTRQIYGLLGNN